MARLKNAVVEQIKQLHRDGNDKDFIEEVTGVSMAAINRIVEAMEGQEDEGKKGEEQSSEEAWSEFWKAKYLETHAQLVELQAIHPQ